MEGQYFTCEIHQKRFKTIQALKQHDLIHHSKAKTSKPSKIQRQISIKSCKNKPLISTEITTLGESNQKIEIPNAANPCELSLVKIKTELNINDHEGESKDSLNRFQCHICSEYFIGESKLSQHIELHIKNNQHHNDGCEGIGAGLHVENILDKIKIEKEEYTLDSKEALNEDISDCGIISISAKDVPKNSKSIPDKRFYKCKFCGKQFRSPFMRRDHLSNEHLDEDFNCKSDGSYTNKAKIDSTSEDENTSDSCCTTSVEKEPKKKKIFIDGKRFYKCEFCGKLFNSYVLRKDHLSNEHLEEDFNCVSEGPYYAYKTKIDSKSDSSKVFQPTIKSTLPKMSALVIRSKYKLPCYFCNMFCNSSNGLERHLWRHTTERPYKCNVCNKAFRHTSEVKRHSVYHTEDRPFQCKICKCKFREMRTLHLHLLTHSEKRSNPCNLCNKAYKRSADLNRHIRTAHSNKYPFKCKHCWRTYNRKDVYKAHVRTAHNIDV